MNSQQESGLQQRSSSRVWQFINAIVLIVSCLSLAVLFPETVYRDNYRNFKRDTNQDGSVVDDNEKNNHANRSVDSVVVDINKRIGDQEKSSIGACLDVCNTLFRDPRSQQICRDQIEKGAKKSQGALLVDVKTFPWLARLQEIQKSNSTEDEMYLEYLKFKEIGVKLPLANRLTGPYLFIMIFVFLGLAASSIGNLIIEAINLKLGRDSVNPPLNSLLLGPVVSCLVAAILVYIFTPSGEERQYFSKKILDIPIAVYISSFLLSFSPVSTVENIAHFVFSQIKTITGSPSARTDGG